MYTLLETPAALRPWVQCIWTECLPPVESARETDATIAPDGCCELIVHLGEPPLERRDGTWARQPRAFVYGQLRGPLHLRAGSGMHAVGVRLHAHAAAALLDVSGSALCAEPLAFSDLSPRLRGLEPLADCEPEDAHPRVVAALGALAASARQPDPLVAAACELLDRCASDARAECGARVAAVAASLGVSRRTLERRFVDAVGLTPKRYARIRRMQRSRELLALPGARIADVAHRAGYADQAHLTRELVELAGCRPGELRASQARDYQTRISPLPPAAASPM